MQQSGTHLSISQGFGWPLGVFEEIVNFSPTFLLSSPLLPLSPHYSCWQETSCLTTFSLLLQAQNPLVAELWFHPGTGGLFEACVSLQKSKRRWHRAAELAPMAPRSVSEVFTTCAHGACGLKVGRKKRPFLIRDSVSVFHLHLDWKKKIWGGTKKRGKRIPRKTMKDELQKPKLNNVEKFPTFFF